LDAAAAAAVAAAAAAAAAAGEERDVPVREHILGVDSNVVFSFFKVVIRSVEFWEYVLIYYHALTLKKYARNFYSCDF
jgi:hypothetical protein